MTGLKPDFSALSTKK